MEKLLIQQNNYREYFKGVIQVAENCDWNVLQNYIRERQNIDVLKILGSCFYTDVLKNIEELEYQVLLNGGEYEALSGNKKIHFGLRRVLAHYSYGAYVYRKGFVDTPFSVVVKQSQDSIPVPTNELRNLKIEHRNIGDYYWELTRDYLCDNRDAFTLFNSNECKNCETTSCNQSTDTHSTRRTKVKIIKK